MFISVVITTCIAFIGMVNYSHAADEIVELPENATTAWVANNLNQNGMVLSIRSFDSPDSVENILAFYRAAWNKEGEVVGFVENVMSEWKLIGKKQGNRNIVLQLKSAERGGATGFLSVAQIDGLSAPASLDFPVPANAEEVSSTYILENGSHVHTVIFITKQSVGMAGEFYRSRLSSKGWTVVQSMTVEESFIMLLNKGNDRCELVIQALNNADTVIYVNRVNQDG